MNGRNRLKAHEERGGALTNREEEGAKNGREKHLPLRSPIRLKV